MKKIKLKDKKTIILIISVVALLVVLFLVFGRNSTSKKDEEKQNENKKVINYALKYEGVFSNNNIEVYLYPIAVNKVFYTIDGNGYYEGVAKANEKNIEDDSFTFTLNDEIVSLSIKDKSISLGTNTFNKISDYSKEDFYKYNIGPIEYATSKYTARFTKDDIEINMIQVSDTEVEIEMHKSSTLNLSGTVSVFEIQDDGTLIEKVLNKDEKQDKIAVDGDKALYIANNEKHKQYDGTYSKSKDLTLDDIIHNKFRLYLAD